MNNQVFFFFLRGLGFDFLTSGLAAKTSSNCFKNSGGECRSISAPSTTIGTLTPEINSKY